MDVQLWEKTIIAWLNILSNSTPIRSGNQINDFLLREILKKIEPDFNGSLAEFLKEVFPNLECDSLALSASFDRICIATLLLLYVSFSKVEKLEEIRHAMCTALDNSTQINIAEFLINIEQNGEVFNFSLKSVKEEILSFIHKNPVPTAGVVETTKTPQKSNITNGSFGSPLQGFFQTPERSVRNSCSMYGGGDHFTVIKKLSNQLVEEELDKASIQEQLNFHIQKCNEYESKLRDKIEEINHLKLEWENESTKNESEITSLKDNILKKFEDEKKLKKELTHLENFVTNLESDLYNSTSKNDKLEYQLKLALEKCAASESQLKETTELNIQLQDTINVKEKELAQLREYYVNFYSDDKSIDISYLDGSFDKSISPPENMGVVIDKLLREKTAENSTLKETVEELEKEKNNLKDELKSLGEQLILKSSEISELQCLNKELGRKIEKFDSTEKELFETQREVVNVKTEIDRLMKENSHLTEKYDILNNGLKESQEDLVNCKNSKMALYIHFIQLAEAFKVVQQRLECEVENISKLTTDRDETFSVLEKKSVVGETGDSVAQCKYDLTRNGLNQSQDVREELKIINNSLTCTDDKFNKLTELLQHFESYNTDWSESKNSMQKTCSQLNDNIMVLKTKIQELEDSQKKMVQEKTEHDKLLRDYEQQIREMQSANNSEIRRLREQLDIRENKIKELEGIILQLRKTQNLTVEKEMVKKSSSKLTCEINPRIIHEGGDYKNIQNSGNNFTRVEKVPAQPLREQELNDSLEEVPVCNKTFDIVNLDEKNATFFIRPEDVKTVKNQAINSTWTVSPPSKVPLKVPSKEIVKHREPKRAQGAAWVVPLAPPKPKERTKKLSASVNDVRVKSEVSKNENNSSITKSSSLSSVIEIDYSPPSKTESKSSNTTSFFGAINSSSNENKDKVDESVKHETIESTPQNVTFTHPSEVDHQREKSSEFSPARNFTLIERSEDPLKYIFNRNLSGADQNKKLALDVKVSDLQKEVLDLSKECERLKSALTEVEQKRKKDKETFEKNQENIRQNITFKYESQLEHLKNEMKQLYNRELAKHKSEQSSLNAELREQNKRYKEHIDELRNQLWDLREKLLAEQKLKRDLERNYNELKKKFENLFFCRELNSKALHESDNYPQKPADDIIRSSTVRQIPNSAFPTIPTEDEEEIFDNRFLEDMKIGVCKTERPEGRLMELQYRNSLCLPHLKSSYPGETQFHNPNLFKETDLKFGMLQFGQESQSLTDSDQSMTRSLLPESKGKKKEQTSYKRPGPPTPSKNGGRLSLQSGDLHLTPRSALKTLNDPNERNKGTPNPLKVLLSSKNIKSGSLGVKDENAAPVTPRKKIKFFRKPFGARDH